LFLWFLLTPPFLVAASLGLQQWLRALLVSSRYARTAVIVGSTKMALDLARTLHERPELGLKLRCVFIDEKSGDLPLDAAADAALRKGDGVEIRRHGSISNYVNARHIDVVFIAREAHAPGVREMCDELRDTTTSVYLIPDVSLYDLMQARIGDVDGIPVIALCESPLQGSSGAIKRFTDIVFATLLLILAAPVMLLIAVAIKLDSPGRVFFKQDRYGLDGERIVVYKFRTMTVCENGAVVVQAKRNDVRVTGVGRWLRRTSLDELPQLINVLQGRMSLVGPRPHAVAHNEEYRKLIAGYMVRHKVTPGITGLAQVSGCRGETSTVEDMRRRVEYDLEYLRHWCWLLDIKIMLRTLVLVFRDKRAY
jgi:putative colanic acid biosynthesis UDP-glucose lipid carrier transferase